MTSDNGSKSRNHQTHPLRPKFLSRTPINSDSLHQTPPPVVSPPPLAGSGSWRLEMQELAIGISETPWILVRSRLTRTSFQNISSSTIRVQESEINIARQGTILPVTEKSAPQHLNDHAPLLHVPRISNPSTYTSSHTIELLDFEHPYPTIIWPAEPQLHFSNLLSVLVLQSSRSDRFCLVFEPLRTHCAHALTERIFFYRIIRGESVAKAVKAKEVEFHRAGDFEKVQPARTRKTMNFSVAPTKGCAKLRGRDWAVVKFLSVGIHIEAFRLEMRSARMLFEKRI
ncbi:MAG: hypothetical protein Q9224_004999 [Gallowayella concinna]